VLLVGSSAAYHSVQEAVRAARVGDTVRVEPGLYIGDVTLDKTLQLEGVGKPVIRGTARGSVIIVTADKCAVRGLVVEHCGGDLQMEDSGILLKSSNNQIEGNDLRDILYGIYLYRSTGNIIRGNTITGRRELEEGERGAGLHLWDSPDNQIEQNTISWARDGLYIQSSPDSTIRRNRIQNLRYGVHYMFSDRNDFEDNYFGRCVAGAAIMYSSYINFRRNAFVHNRGFSSFGILFQECDFCIAEDNIIADNAIGIFMEALRKSMFRNNLIAGNDVALQVFSSADENTFHHNTFLQNLSPLQLIGRATTTRWALNGHGNHWSDYSGYDLDGDGIGDRPHRIQNVFEYMEGNHPRLRLYLESPAAQALGMAEKAFPIVRASSEIDPAPLMGPGPMPISFEEDTRHRYPHFLLFTLSTAWLEAAAGLIWWGRRR